MTTCDQVLTQIKASLAAVAGRDRINRLDTSVTAGDTSIVLSLPPDAATVPGSVVAIEHELCYVYAVSGSTLTVERGYLGSTAASHTAPLVVEVEPKWPRSLLMQHLTDEIQSWPEDLFLIATTTLTVPSGTTTFDLTGALNRNVTRVLEVERRPGDGALYPWHKPQVRLVPNMDTSVFTSGWAVQLDAGLVFDSEASLRVTYGYTPSVSALTPSTDLNSTTGMPSSWLDIIKFGVQARALVEKDALRNDLTRQGQSRHAEEVPPGSWMKTAQMWQMTRDRRLSEERVRLVAKYPWSGRF